MSGITTVAVAPSGTRHQHYRVDVPNLPSAAALSVHSFKATEALGDTYRIEVTLSHPESLTRHDLLGKDATFRMVSDDGTPRRFAGCVTQFRHVKRTADEYTYELVIEPHVARLRLTEASRNYQHQTGPQIIEAILRRHGLKGHQFAFKLRRDYPEHVFRMQYRCSDWDYIKIILEQEGLYSYFEEGEHGNTPTLTNTMC